MCIYTYTPRGYPNLQGVLGRKEPKARNLTSHVLMHYCLFTWHMYISTKVQYFLFIIKYAFLFPLFHFLHLSIV